MNDIKRFIAEMDWLVLSFEALAVAAWLYIAIQVLGHPVLSAIIGVAIGIAASYTLFGMPTRPEATDGTR